MHGEWSHPSTLTDAVEKILEQDRERWELKYDEKALECALSAFASTQVGLAELREFVEARSRACAESCTTEDANLHTLLGQIRDRPTLTFNPTHFHADVWPRIKGQETATKRYGTLVEQDSSPWPITTGYQNALEELAHGLQWNLHGSMGISKLLEAVGQRFMAISRKVKQHRESQRPPPPSIPTPRPKAGRAERSWAPPLLPRRRKDP